MKAPPNCWSPWRARGKLCIIATRLGDVSGVRCGAQVDETSALELRAGSEYIALRIAGKW
jgi:hypothetical protein